MLVLTRKRYESIVLANEITVTVEEISDGSGDRLPGTRVRLGFQCPRHVSIERSECRARNSRTARWGQGSVPPAPRPGVLREVPNAQVRLHIRVPPKVPVCLNGTPTLGLEAEPAVGDTCRGTMTDYRITCHQEDIVTICRNISVAAVGFLRFVPSDLAAVQEVC
jgi:carbon storage regulator CsrA